MDSQFIDPILWEEARRLVDRHYSQIVKKARKLKEFQQLSSRNFRDIEGYTSWDQVCELMAVELFGSYEAHPSLLEKDFVKNITLPNYTIAAHRKADVWWLGEELGRAFLDSEIRENVLEIKRVTPSGIIMLPKGLIKTPDGEDILFLCFTHWLEREVPRPIGSVAFSPVQFDQLLTCTTTAEGTTYGSSLGLIQRGKELLDYGEWKENKLLGEEKRKSQEVETVFLKKLDRIVLQTLLLIQTYPEFLETPPKESRATRGIGNTKKKSASKREPVWIGRQFRYDTERKPSAPTGKAAGDRKPKKGYWRYLNAEKGFYKETRWVWNRPERRE